MPAALVMPAAMMSRLQGAVAFFGRMLLYSEINAQMKLPRLLAALLITLPASAVEHRVTSAADIAQAAESARPGDVLLMADGAWTDQRIDFRAKGTAEQPVTLRAETAGKVVLGGESSMVIEGAHLVVTGLHFKDTTAKGDCVKLAGEHCRLTETAVTGGAHKFFVHVFGTENRMDHCYLADKTSDSPTLQIEAEGKPNRHRIDHNHFGPRPPLGRNGGEWNVSKKPGSANDPLWPIVIDSSGRMKIAAPCRGRMGPPYSAIRDYTDMVKLYGWRDLGK